MHNVDFVQYNAPVSKIALCMSLGYIRHWGIFAIEKGWTLGKLQIWSLKFTTIRNVFTSLRQTYVKRYIKIQILSLFNCEVNILPKKSTLCTVQSKQETDKPGLGKLCWCCY